MDQRLQAALEKLAAIHAANLEGGGREHVARQHARGKLTARERIAQLVDAGSFSELGACVNSTSQRIDGRRTEAPCDGAVCGTGRVDGRRVAVYASDFTVLGGSIGTQHGLKMVKLMEMARRWRIPMVWLLDSSGGRLGYTDVPMAGIDWWFALQSRYSGLIPQINVLMGPCIAGQAYCPALCDFLLMSRGTAHLWLGGPRMTQAATSEKIGEDVGGADYHMAYSGTCDLVGDNDAQTIALARELLGFLPSNWRQPPPRRPPGADPAPDDERLSALVPADCDTPYDVHPLIESLVDDGRFFEIKADYAKALVTGFCRFEGQVAGLVANNPAAGGMLTRDACDKYYRFLQVLDAYGIPLVNLVDTPPVLPGEAEEAGGVLRHLGKVIDLYAQVTVPKISVVLREAYADAGGLVMGVGKGMGVDLCYAWPIARFAVEASVRDWAAAGLPAVEADAHAGYLDRAREKVDVFEAARSWTAQVVDEVIAPADTRRRIVDALALCAEKEEALPARAKLHGTGPS